MSQWSTEPKQDLVLLFGIWFSLARFSSVLFSVSRKTKPNIYRIKSKIKGFHEVLAEIFLFRNSVMREMSMDHSKISAVMAR